MLAADEVVVKDDSVRIASLSQDDGDFVALGRLEKLSSGAAKSRYVLLDAAGDIISYLSPADGLEMGGHVGSQVGLTGHMIDNGPDKLPSMRVEQISSLKDERSSHSDDPGSSDDLVKSASAEVFVGPGDDVTVTPAPPQSQAYQPITPIIPGGAAGTPMYDSCAVAPCGPLGRTWFDFDFLVWVAKEMSAPPLVTTSPAGTDPGDAGVLPGATVLFGGALLDDVRSGGRIKLGRWLDDSQWVGIEGEYLGINREKLDFLRSSEGDPILARPFFNVTIGEADAQLIALPGAIGGRIQVHAASMFQSAGIRGLWNMRCRNGSGCGTPGCNRCFPSARLDLIGGYRYARLDDGLVISETISTTEGGAAVSIDSQDSFGTENHFNGADFGARWLGQRRRLSLEVLGKIAFGNVRQEADIVGNTIIVPGGFQQRGGLLALQTNDGFYKRDRFAVLPEFGANAGFQITERARLTFGYSVIYWNKVLRAGDQIDLNVNENFIPPVTPVGPAVPQFVFNETDYWVQGINFGVDYRW